MMSIFNKRSLGALLLFLALFSLRIEAQSLDEQRSLFQAAEQALDAGDRSVLTTRRDALRSYPLYLYLVYTDLRQRLANYPAAEVRAFLGQYPDTPLAPSLREQWLKLLAAQQRWQAVLSDYVPTDNVELQCLQRQALLQTGQAQQALDGIEQIWLHGDSRPKACNPVFAVWREQGGFTQARIWQRFQLSIDAGQTKLAGYLSGLLREPLKSRAELWLQVHAQPKAVLDRSRFAALDQHTAQIVIHGLTRWSGRDSVEAAAAFDRLQAYLRFPPSDELDALRKRLALFVAARGDASAARRLQNLPPQQVDEAVEEWRVRAALRSGDWNAVLRWIDAMRPATRKQLAWRYWQARALAQTGQQEAAKALYQELAQQRDYYGFLAADQIGVEYTLRHVPTALNNEVLAAFKTDAAIRRVEELRHWQKDAAARSEWVFALKGADRETLRAAAHVAHGWQWHDRVITALAQANDWDDLDLRFPMPHRPLVNQYAAAYKINPAWVYAIMRKESIFQQDIRSGAGALGLMQVMPATGKKIAADIGAAWSGPYTLLQRNANIRFGSYYLRAGLDRFANNSMLASAAYNAGPHRVQDWLAGEPGRVASDIWAELIPFSETRAYAKRVLEYTVVYSHRLGQPVRLQSLMPAL